MIALFSSSWDLPDAYQSLKPVLLRRLPSTEVSVNIQVAKGTIGIHIATHRCGHTLVSTFRFEPCNPSGLRHLPPHLPLSTCHSGHSTGAPDLAVASPLLPAQPHRSLPLLSHFVPSLAHTWHPLPPYSNSLHTSRPFQDIDQNHMHSSSPGQERSNKSGEERQGKAGRLEGRV